MSANDEKINLLISALVDGLDNVAALSEELKQLDASGNKQVPDNTRELREGAKKTADQLRNAGQGTEEWLSQLNNMKGELALAAGAIYGLQKTLGGAAGASSDFNQAMAEVSTLLDDTSDVDGMAESVRSLSIEYGGDAKDNAKALYDIISAGASDSATATEQLRVANQLAMGGVTDVKTAADGLTSTLNAYGDAAGGAANVSDAFFTAVKAGKTTVGELSGSIGTLAPLAKTAGVSLDELLASVASLTAGGVSTSESMTQMKGALTSIIKPSKEAQDLAAELGIEFNAASLQTKGWAGFLEEVKTATGGNVETMGQLFGSVEGLNAVLALTGEGSQKFADTMQEMAEKTGATATAVEKMMDTPAARSARFQAALQGVNLAVGDAVTAFAPLLDSLTSLITQFTELEPGTRTAVAGVGALAVALPPAVLAVGSLAKAVGILRGGFTGSATASAAHTTALGATTAASTAATVATKALGTAMKALPLVALAAPIAAAGDALWEWSKAVDQADEAEARLAKTQAEQALMFERLSEETGHAITNLQEFTQAKRDGLVVFDEETKRWTASIVVLERMTAETAKAVEAAGRQAEWAEAHADSASKQAKAIVEAGMATQRWTEALGAVDLKAKDADKAIEKLVKSADLANSNEFAGLIKGLDAVKEDTPELVALFEKELLGAIEKLDNQGLENLSRSLKQAFDDGNISAEQFSRKAGSIVEIAAKRMGVDIAEALGRITPATKDALLNIDTLANGLKGMGLTAEEQSKVIGAAMEKAFASAKTKEDIVALQERLKVLGDQGVLTGADMALMGELGRNALDGMSGSTEDLTKKVITLRSETKGLGSETEDTTDKIKQQGEATGGVSAAIGNHLKVLREEFAGMGESASAAFDDMLEKSTIAGESVHVFINRFNENVATLREQLQDVQRTQESWADSTVASFADMETASERQLRSTELNIRSMDMLDETRLDAVRSQIDRLRQANEQLEQSLESTLSSLRDELDQMENNRAAIEERDYQRKREELQQQLDEARAAGNRQAQQDAEESLRLLEQIHRKKMDDIKAEKAAREQSDRERDDRDQQRSEAPPPPARTPTTTTTTNTPNRTVRFDLTTRDKTIPVVVDASREDDLIELLKELQRRS
ncbi:phage tail tape measure protein [Guyparkeria sp.]|uniref:phage tail tape measure protein n=1 Tax=Guyparkeria sp. TaxID=2035736 RepID=UPI003970541C